MGFTIPKNSVFVSVGNELTAAQESLVSAIEAMLLAKGLQPVTLGRNVPGNDDPLKTIQIMISGTRGTLVVAFIRFRVTLATEYPPTEAASFVTHRNLTTVWNQVEAAMAYQAKKPLLILLEHDVHPEGIIDPAVYPCLEFTTPQHGNALPDELKSALKHWLGTFPASR